MDREHDREILARRLSSHDALTVVGEASGVSASEDILRRTNPDVVLIDTHHRDGADFAGVSFLSRLDLPQRPAVVAFLDIVHAPRHWPVLRAWGADEILLQEMTPEAIAFELKSIVDRVTVSLSGQ